ncbi:unnamed protein product [Durusdinium trenchii]|uniref:E3 ubiquitin-protein ligase listerin (RING-type E3 ubiquitin transferase listerin) n=2 Tax=Durusdinium trenchii TaxID=1381693 RepID=A0ABP0H940_9DINO
MASEAHGAGLGAMYRACLQRETDGSYGVMLSADAEMTVLVILDFRGSHAVQRWNQKHPQCPILVGHVVVEVVDLLIHREQTSQQAQVHASALAMHRWSQTVEELLHSAGCVERARSLRAEVVETCAICQDDLSLEVVALPCSHHFHHSCIKEWFISQSNARCPMCNQVFARAC